MASIQTRTDSNGKTTFRVQVRLRGFPAETATFDRITDARKWGQSREAALREGRHFQTTEGKRRTLSDAIARYKETVLPRKKQSSRHAQAGQYTWWNEQLGAYTLAQITPAMIAECRDRLLNDPEHPKSNATTVRYLAALSHLFSVAVKEWGWLESNPCTRVTKPKEPRGRVRFLSDDERDRLLTACRESSHEDLYTVVVLALSTGGRQSEVTGLRWPHVDLDRGAVTFTDTKNGDTRTVPVTGEALALLRERARVRHITDDRVFRGSDIRWCWGRAVEAAEIKDFHFHDLRHSCASYLAMSGATVAELASVLGHRTLAMVQRYSHLSEQHTAGVMRRMHEKFLGTQESEVDHG